MHTRRGPRGALAAVPVALALLLTACGGGGAEEGGSGDGGTPKPGGRLRLALTTDPITLNPRGKTSGNEAMYVLRQMYDSLVEQNPDTGAFEPWLAESWKISKDARTFTFTLRQGVTFSDGSPLTAQVAKDNFDDILANSAQESPQIVTAFAAYKGSRAVDARTVEVTFTTPNAPFLAGASSPQFAMISPAALKRKFEERGDQVAGTGPFVLKSYRKNAGVLLAKRPGYAWAPRSRAHAGDAYLDEVEFPVIPEAGVRTGSLATEDVDAMAGLLPADVKTVRRGGARIVSRPKPGTVYGLMPLVNVPPLDDVAVRRALAHGIDGKEVVDTVLSPEFKPATGAVTSTTPGYTDLRGTFAFDPRKAEAALDAAGWRRGADGIRAKDGKRLSLPVGWFTQFSGSQQALELIKAQLAKIGVEITLVKKTPAEIVAGLAASEFGFFWYNIAGADGDVLRQVYTDAPPNYLHRDDPRLQELLGRQAAIQDPAERAKVLADIQRHIHDQALVLPVFEETTLIATAPSVHGLRLDAGAMLGSLYGAWLS
ncbi:ABC transporter substrate-binding protein [Actinomadura rugatobispora]|uniref:ABC transporter substrate-binding protein n=1 Tax=Actinomadura rugatobispora TaxID=1994 RepID=A0ABW1A189_9ACTN|nr:ABC transporter substrate-binding protein [Actinomadura rugatobispora]